MFCLFLVIFDLIVLDEDFVFWLHFAQMNRSVYLHRFILFCSLREGTRSDAAVILDDLLASGSLKLGVSPKVLLQKTSMILAETYSKPLFQP